MNNIDIQVSICCMVYNHEKYLQKCLDGFVMQKTNFKYEILIHDDASIDNSAQIIKDYEKKYPNIIKPIYQKENQYTKGIPINWIYNYPRARGKYIALCEGDDFWTDDNKLQLQFDILEKNQNAVMCVHRVHCVSEQGELIDEFIPGKEQFNDDLVIICDEWIKHQLEYKWYFQTSSYFYRKSIIDNIIGQVNDGIVLDKRPKFMINVPVGDTPLMLYMCLRGDLVYLNMEMSSYRTNSNGSWTSRLAGNTEKRIQTLNKLIIMMNEFDKYTNYKYSKLIQLRCNKYEFEIIKLKKDYKRIFESKYRSILKECSFREIIFNFVNAYFPTLYKCISRLKSSLLL